MGWGGRGGVTYEEGVVLEDVSGVDSGHVLIGCIASVLVVLNLTHCWLLLHRVMVRAVILIFWPICQFVSF